MDKINREEFLKINEDNVIFITNPGRMGDENGSTFVVKQNNQIKIYRIDGWLYHNNDLSEDELISLKNAIKQFPQWYNAWNNSNNKKYRGKYKYLYMGFGNGLSIDNSIYNTYEPYLLKHVDKYLAQYKDEEKENLRYSAIYNVWKNALMDMIKDKKI